MPRASTIVVAGLLAVLCAGAVAQEEPDYFPLQVGNHWVYEHTKGGLEQADSTDGFVLEVLAKEEMEGKPYFRLSNGLLVRKDDQGNIIEYNDRFEGIDEQELLVLDFASPDSEDEPGHFRYHIPYAAYPPTVGGESISESWVSYVDRAPLHAISVSAGAFSQGHTFLYGDWTYATAVHFVSGIGVVRSGRGSDTDWERYELLEATINGRRIGRSAVERDTWGHVKSFFP